MDNMNNRDKLNAIFDSLFDEVVQQYIDEFKSGKNPFIFSMPEEDVLSTKSTGELGQYVAMTSNLYTKASHLVGIAKQEVKRAQHVYTYAYKMNRTGKNEDERTMNALEASQNEAEQLNFAERVLAFAERAALAAQLASESARKILDKASDMQTGDARQQYGQSKSPNVIDDF